MTATTPAKLCPTCSGTSYVGGEDCPKCGGTGTVETPATTPGALALEYISEDAETFAARGPSLPTRFPHTRTETMLGIATIALADLRALISAHKASEALAERLAGAILDATHCLLCDNGERNHCMDARAGFGPFDDDCNPCANRRSLLKAFAAWRGRGEK